MQPFFGILAVKSFLSDVCNRGILGANVQYMNYNKICIKKLEVIENLYSEIKALVSEFNLRKDQIYR